MTTIALETSHDLKARVRRSLPSLTLEQIRIASPCTASWADMRGDDRSRRCGQCDKVVHDLSAMTRAEAEALVNGPGPTPCVRVWVRHDGTVITQDCPVGLAKVRRHLRRIGAAFGALFGWIVGLAGCTRDEPAVDPGAPPARRVEPAGTPGPGVPPRRGDDAGPADTTGAGAAVVASSAPVAEPPATKKDEAPRCVMGAPPPPPQRPR